MPSLVHGGVQKAMLGPRGTYGLIDWKYGGHLHGDYLIFYLIVLIIGGKDADTVMGEEFSCHFDYVTNLAEVFSCDFNPPRQGGGTAIAMSVGCAVVSLEEGDGATLIDPEDLCADLDEFFERLSRLTDSKGFRTINQTRAKHQVQELDEVSLNYLYNFSSRLPINSVPSPLAFSRRRA